MKPITREAYHLGVKRDIHRGWAGWLRWRPGLFAVVWALKQVGIRDDRDRYAVPSRKNKR